MMKVGTDVPDKMYSKIILYAVFILCPTAFAEAVVDAPTEDAVADYKCGYQGMFIYDAVNDRCLVNFKTMMKKVVVVYHTSDLEVLADDEMAKSIYIEGENLFKGIIISVIIFIVCASVCIVAACIYCCRINYTDRTLKKNVKAVAKKLNKDYSSKTVAPKRVPLPPISHSCSVVVEPAGVIVV